MADARIQWHFTAKGGDRLDATFTAVRLQIEAQYLAKMSMAYCLAGYFDEAEFLFTDSRDMAATARDLRA